MVAKALGHLLVIAVLASALLAPGVSLALTVGEPAPDFTLQSTAGNPISLSEFRGKKMVLVEFYGINFGAT